MEHGWLSYPLSSNVQKSFKRAFQRIKRLPFIHFLSHLVPLEITGLLEPNLAKARETLDDSPVHHRATHTGRIDKQLLFLDFGRTPSAWWKRTHAWIPDWIKPGPFWCEAKVTVIKNTKKCFLFVLFFLPKNKKSFSLLNIFMKCCSGCSLFFA